LIPRTLDSLIPPDHPVRLVDEILSGLDWRAYEAEYHGRRGQPPIHPSVLAKILLFAMIRRLRSSRQIEYELKHSIDFMWLSSGRQIDHTTLSEFRRRHSDGLRSIFRQMIRLAIDLKIANLSELCIDGTRVLADANRYRTWTAARLSRALEQLDSQIAEAMENLDVADTLERDLLGEDSSADRLPQAVANLKERREQLAALQETAREMDEIRRKNGSQGPAQLPRADPDSRILPNKEGGYAANYTPMATTETQGGLVVHSDVLIGNVEHDQLPDIVDEVNRDHAADVKQILVDSAYTTGRNLTTAEEQQFEITGPLAELHVPDNPALRADLTQPVASELIENLPVNPQTRRFDKSAFVYEEKSNSYYCPAGKQLPHRTTEKATRSGGRKVTRYIYTCGECSGCELAARCRRKPDSKRGREVIDDEHESARRHHRVRMQSENARQDIRRRQHTAEVPFAVIKACFGMRRFLLRGIAGVKQERRWGITAFNLKKLMAQIDRIRPNESPSSWNER